LPNTQKTKTVVSCLPTRSDSTVKKGIFLALLLLAAIYSFRTDFFSPSAISGPLFGEMAPAMDPETEAALAQPYRFLGKGRQSFAFASEDGKWVIKFFNQNYFRLPFYAAWIDRERTKREKRKRFYLESYRIAASELKEETGILYLHLGPSMKPLPSLSLTDRKGKRHCVDLNELPFVLQRKAEPLYPALLGSMPVQEAIEQFLSLVAKRIEKKIGDADHDVEHNFGIYQGRVIHLDPGRLYFEEGLLEPERLVQEWWSATHRFRNWLEEERPESVTFFDHALETIQRRVLQRPGVSQALRRDGQRQERSPVFSVFLLPCVPQEHDRN
jgi:hypothetical protein